MLLARVVVAGDGEGLGRDAANNYCISEAAVLIIWALQQINATVDNSTKSHCSLY